MSGALGSAFAGAGFVRSLVSSVMVQNPRKIVWPLTAANGQPIQIYKAGITAGANPPSLGQATGSLGGYVAILEEHRDETEITEHPVQQGSTIADHAFELPNELVMQIGWTPSSAAGSGLPNLLGILPIPSLAGFTGAGNNNLVKQLYQQLLTIKAQRLLLTVYTGKRIYQNMLIKMLSERTTKETENSLIITATFKRIIIANVTTVQAPVNAAAQAAPQDTSPSVPQGSQSLQPAPAFNSPTVAA